MPVIPCAVDAPHDEWRPNFGPSYGSGASIDVTSQSRPWT
jgi:hypothetical protein